SSWLPLLSALGLAGVCLGLLFKTWVLAVVAAPVSLVLLLLWSWKNGLAVEARGTTAATGLPLHSQTFDSPGRWGMGFTLLADSSLYLSLVFGWLFLWTSAPHWTRPEQPPLSPAMLVAIGALVVLAAVHHGRIVSGLRRGGGIENAPSEPGRSLALRTGAVMLAGLLASGGLLAILGKAPLEPSRNAHDAVVFVMLVYLLLHTGLGCLLTALQALRAWWGLVGPHAPYEFVVLTLWWRFTAAASWIGIAALVLVPIAFEDLR